MRRRASRITWRTSTTSTNSCSNPDLNFLAHFQLAWPDEGLVLGALEGDYYKGPVGDDIPADIAHGVRLHRAIDAFTDSHPQVAALRRDFPQNLRRYAGIVIDLGFDHYLTRHWHHFHTESLPAFNAGVLQTLQARSHNLGAESQRMLDRLAEYDILNRYHDWRSVTGSAERIGERFRRGNPLVAIETEVDPMRSAIEDTFLAFYPELQAFVSDWRRQ